LFDEKILSLQQGGMRLSLFILQCLTFHDCFDLDLNLKIRKYQQHPGFKQSPTNLSDTNLVWDLGIMTLFSNMQ